MKSVEDPAKADADKTAEEKSKADAKKIFAKMEPTLAVISATCDSILDVKVAELEVLDKAITII